MKVECNASALALLDQELRHSSENGGHEIGHWGVFACEEQVLLHELHADAAPDLVRTIRPCRTFGNSALPVKCDSMNPQTNAPSRLVSFRSLDKVAIWQIW
jgi:hypothetical protein